MRGQRGLTLVAVMAVLLAAAACGPAGSPPTPEAVAGQPRPSAVAGYEYEDVAPDDFAQTSCSTIVSDLNAAAPGLVTGWSVHRVLSDGAYTIRLVALRIDRSAAPQPFSEEALLDSVLVRAVGVLAPVTEWAVSGRRIRGVDQTVDGNRRVACAWLSDGVLTLLAGVSRETVEAYAEGLLEGSSG